jgi:hypothetical protein
MHKLAGSVLLVVLPLCGCVSLSSGGANVRLVDDASLVKSCRSVGMVSASPPFNLPSDWKIKLRNQAAERGGDTAYAKSPGLSVGSVDGEAFVCASQAAPR